MLVEVCARQLGHRDHAPTKHNVRRVQVVHDIWSMSAAFQQQLARFSRVGTSFCRQLVVIRRIQLRKQPKRSNVIPLLVAQLHQDIIHHASNHRILCEGML